ncbi:ribosome biogenesis protein TSR3 isoform X1, partial [Aphis craccivora]
CPPVSFNNNLIPTTPVVKYLGLTFDKRLTWAQHLKNKRKSVNSRVHLLRPLPRSKLNISNKLLIYKAILRPAWALKPANYTSLPINMSPSNRFCPLVYKKR